MGVHMNTTLPQISLIAHTIELAGTPLAQFIAKRPDYFPSTYNAFILNPNLSTEDQQDQIKRMDQETPEYFESKKKEGPRTIFDYFQQGPPAKRRRIVPRLTTEIAFRIRTSIGETLMYSLGRQGAPPTFVRIYLKPSRGGMWRIGNSTTNATATRIEDLVESLDHVRRNHNKRLYQRYLIMQGSAPVNSLPLLPFQLEKQETPGESACCHQPLISDERTSSEICSLCGRSYNSNQITRKCIGHDHWSPCSRSTYKRMNHLHEWITQFQGKERNDLDQEVIDLVRKQFEKERAPLSSVTARAVRNKLKILGKPYTKYYEHSTQIAWRISDIPPPQLSERQEEAICIMFRDAQLPFEEMPPHIKPTNRKNFLSYPYFLLKACELKGYVTLLPCFQKLKSSQKIFEHDAMWKYICNRNGWKFIPTSIIQNE